MSFIPYGRQLIEQDDIDALVSVLHSDYLTQGPTVVDFESAICSGVGSSFAVAANSATSALHVAYLALGVGVGDVVWCPANTFVATSNAALYCGAEVEFIDIDTNTLNISVESLSDRLEGAARIGRLPKVVTVVHFAGNPVDLEGVDALAKQYGFRVVEDASHAVGATYKGHPIGKCNFSDISVFSFHPVKIVTSGEGGVATTNDEELAIKMALFRSHGVTRQAEKFSDKLQGAWHYEQKELGYNYRMTELEAVLGISQFKKRERFITIRKNISDAYRFQLDSYQFQELNPNGSSSHHLEVIRVPSGQRRQLFDMLRSQGVGVNVHYMPVYWHPFYRKLRADWPICEEAEKYYRQAISLPIHAAMSEEDQAKVIGLLIRGTGGSQTIF